ncbi:MAG: DUF4124 domain-containing protein [Cytophagales bacterium]|nr:DUF4124 domain-containing protein [Rhizobacter sp.]
MRLRVTVFALSLLFSVSLNAADIYKWIDESGRTQISDVVPEKYRKSAKRFDSKTSELSAEQRRDAESRAIREKAQAAEAQEQSSRSKDRGLGASASGVASSAPRQSGNASADCPTLRRLYRESQMCFAPYRMANGTTKAEGFEKCNVVIDPVLKCGMESSN